MTHRWRSEFVDMLLCKITLNIVSFPILTVHRSPQVSQEENESMLAATPYVCQFNSECPIVRELNAPSIDWDTPSCPTYEAFEKKTVP